MCADRIPNINNILSRTSYQIENFHNKLISRPDDFSHDSLHDLLHALKESREALAEHESIKGNFVKIDPKISQRMNTVMAAIEKQLAIPSKGAQEKNAALIVAMSALQEFARIVRNVSPKEDKSLKRGKKVENVSGGSEVGP